MTAAYTVQEVLGQLDDCARDFTFPMLDNGYIYPADVRLSAYRDDIRWALVIEQVGYNVRVGGNGGADNCLHCFGNCLGRSPGTDFLFMLDDGPEGPTFDDEYGWYVREGVKNVRVRNVVTPVDLTQELLAREGIELEEPPRVTGAELLRSLLPECREVLFATEGELRARVPPDLPLILRLDEWHHPDVSGEELPSGSETFRMIAEVLVTGDGSFYKPNRGPNTHWRNWPEGGKL